MGSDFTGGSNFDFLHWLCIWALTQCCATALPVITNPNHIFISKVNSSHPQCIGAHWSISFYDRSNTQSRRVTYSSRTIAEVCMHGGSMPCYAPCPTEAGSLPASRHTDEGSIRLGMYRIAIFKIWPEPDSIGYQTLKRTIRPEPDI